MRRANQESKGNFYMNEKLFAFQVMCSILWFQTAALSGVAEERWSVLISPPKAEDIKLFAVRPIHRVGYGPAVTRPDSVLLISKSEFVHALENSKVITDGGEFAKNVGRSTRCTGAALSITGDLYLWELHSTNQILLSDCDNNLCVYVCSNTIATTEIRLKRQLMNPPDIANVDLFCNAPGMFREDGWRIDQKHVNSILRSHREPTSISGPEADKLRQSLRHSAEGAIYELSGEGALIANGKILFWHLLSRDTLYLETSEGLSCLLNKE